MESKRVSFSVSRVINFTGRLGHDLISATAIHLLALLVCTFLTLALLGGKTPHEILPLLFGVYVPFFFCGQFVVKQRLMFPKILSPLGGVLTFVVIGSIVIWNRDGDWSASRGIGFAVPACIVSYFGVLFSRDSAGPARIQRSKN